MQNPEIDGLVSDAEGAANSATGLAGNFMEVSLDYSRDRGRFFRLIGLQFRRDLHENSARQVDGIADSVSGAMDSGIDQDTDLADTIMPERRGLFGDNATPSQSSPSSQSSQPSKQKQSNNMLKEIATESGLGGLFGNAHHGLGLFPVCS